MIYSLLRKALFHVDPEKTHDAAMRVLETIQNNASLYKLVKQKYTFNDPRLQVKLNGISFANPVGLAAGFDKDASAFLGLSALGFGFIEVGTITPKPQAGQQKPRLFRLPEANAIINRMGFNNKGATNAARNFNTLARPVQPMGINIGKNKDTPNERALSDYISCFSDLYNYGDYFVINVSSPNTKALRELQEIDHLHRFMEGLISTRETLYKKLKIKRPLYLKVSPDLTDIHLRQVVKLCLELGIDGIVATNTTIERQGINSSEQGGLSGHPLKTKATECIRLIFQESKGKLPIIGVGGIFNGADAYEKIRAGASLVQIYTGLIYKGPAIVKNINRQLLQKLNQDGLSSVVEAIGMDS